MSGPGLTARALICAWFALAATMMQAAAQQAGQEDEPTSDGWVRKAFDFTAGDLDFAAAVPAVPRSRRQPWGWCRVQRGRKAPAGLATAIAAGLAISSGPAHADDTVRCFDSHDYAAQGTAPFPDQMEAVVRAWGEPIPDNLRLVGGVDWFGWARVCRHEGDPPGTFRGEYRDALILYEGTFRHQSSGGDVLPDGLFDDFIVSHYDPGVGLMLGSRADGPLQWFTLVLAEPHRLRTDARR